MPNRVKKILFLTLLLTFMSSHNYLSASFGGFSDEDGWGQKERRVEKDDWGGAFKSAKGGADKGSSVSKGSKKEKFHFGSEDYGDDSFVVYSEDDEEAAKEADIRGKKRTSSDAKFLDMDEIEDVSSSEEVKPVKKSSSKKVIPVKNTAPAKKPASKLKREGAGVWSNLEELKADFAVRAKVDSPAKKPKTKSAFRDSAEEDLALQGDEFANDDDPFALMPKKEVTKKPAKEKSNKSPKHVPATKKRDASELVPAQGSSHLVQSDKILKLVRMTDDFKNKKVICLDFETTSFSSKIGGRAISLGFLMLDNGVEKLRWEAVFNPDKDSNKGAFLAHGISRSVTRHMPHFEEVADEIIGILSQADHIVAHNAKFDWRYLTAEIQRAGIINVLKKRNFARLLADESPLSAINKTFLNEQVSWINDKPHIQDKRLYMFQSRLTTALWLYIYEKEVLMKGDLFDKASGRFAVPFLPTPKSVGAPNVAGYAKSVNAALLDIYKKMEALKGRTKSEKDYIKWKKFESVDISENDNFTPVEIRRKALLDKQIRAVALIKKFTFVELEWNKVYNWQRVGQESSVFYNKSDCDLLGQITGYLNLARDLVENKLYQPAAQVPRFLDYEATWIDSLVLAKETLEKGKDIAGYKLDAVLDYFDVDRSSRNDGHGALIDSVLLAKAYAKLRGTGVVEVAANDNRPTKKQSIEKETKVDQDDDEEELAESQSLPGDAPSGAGLIGGLF